MIMLGQWDGSVSKGACFQIWPPKFDPRDLDSRMKKNDSHKLSWAAHLPWHNFLLFKNEQEGNTIYFWMRKNVFMKEERILGWWL